MKLVKREKDFSFWLGARNNKSLSKYVGGRSSVSNFRKGDWCVARVLKLVYSKLVAATAPCNPACIEFRS